MHVLVAGSHVCEPMQSASLVQAHFPSRHAVLPHATGAPPETHFPLPSHFLPGSTVDGSMQVAAPHEVPAGGKTQPDDAPSHVPAQGPLPQELGA